MENGVLPFKNMNLKNHLEKFKVNIAEKVNSLLKYDEYVIFFFISFIYGGLFVVTYSLGVSSEIFAFIRRFLLLIALFAFIVHYYVFKIKKL